jgi:hypothetical protein
LDWNAIGAIGELIGAIAVIVTLVYLAQQLRQNTRQLARSSTEAAQAAMYQNNLFAAGHPDLLEVNERGMKDFDHLDSLERARFHVFWMTCFIAYQDGYREFKDGRIDDSAWRPIEVHLFRYMKMPGMQAWWRRERSSFGREFAEYVERGVLETDAPHRDD